jgi:hypothetical protein
MAIVVTMKDVLTQRELDEDYVQAMNQLNMASAQGKAFMSMDDMNGGHVMFNIPNILIVEEVTE